MLNRVLGRSLILSINSQNNDQQIKSWLKENVIPHLTMDSFVNLTDKIVPQEVQSFCSRGLSFIPNQNSLFDSFKDLFSILHDQENLSMEDTKNCLKKFKNFIPTNTESIMFTIVTKFIKESVGKFIITKADKTAHTVFMKKEDYIQMGYEIIKRFNYKKYEINDKYKALRFIQFSMVSELNKIFDLKWKYKIDLEDCRFFPYLYCLPKINKNKTEWLKDNIPPGRPIIACKNSFFETASKFLNNILKKHVFKENHFIRNSEELTNKLNILHQNVNLDMCKIIVFDIKELYLNIDLEILMKKIRNYLHLKFSLRKINSITNSISRIFYNQFFTFDNNLYKQDNGIYMGNVLSPTLAYLYLLEFDKFIINQNQVKLYVRYIDDVICIVEQNFEFPFHILSNEYNLTFSDLNVGRLVTFLDLTIWINEKNEMDYCTFFKPLHPFNYVHFASWHNVAVKRGIVKSQFLRMLRTNKQNDLKLFFIEMLSRKFLSLGYPLKMIKKVRFEILNNIKKPKIESNLPWTHLKYHPALAKAPKIIYDHFKEIGKENKKNVGFYNPKNQLGFLKPLHPAAEERLERKEEFYKQEFYFENKGLGCYRPEFNIYNTNIKNIEILNQDLRNLFKETISTKLFTNPQVDFEKIVIDSSFLKTVAGYAAKNE